MANLNGRILEIKDIIEVTDTFKKREMAVEVAGKYPQQIPLQFTQNNVYKLDAYKKGDIVSIEYDLRGREYKNKNGEIGYFLSLNAWKIELEQNDPAPYQDKTEIDNHNELPF